VAQILIRAKPYKRGTFNRNPLPRDYQAIGEFITATSLIEVVLHRAIRRWLGLDEGIARALIGEPRHGELLDKLKFAFQNHYGESLETALLIDPICGEMIAINNVRSVVAHKPCWTDGVALAFSNGDTASKASKKFVYVCTHKQLKGLADWASEVGYALKCSYEQEYPGRPLDAFAKRLSSLDRSKLPAPPPNKSQPTAKQKPQRQPSRGK
jgi:hypothetical protein